MTSQFGGFFFCQMDHRAVFGRREISRLHHSFVETSQVLEIHDPVVAWEARAKFAQQYFHKGQLAVVEGRLQIRDWTDKDGGKRRSAEVIADGIYFAGAKAAQPSEGNADEGTLPPPPAGDLQDLDDDGELPF